ncbi:predicted protein [Arabidopsis lyrata subsp. lyrata]|uniref:Predicted protein n=1 Tax=Arabidopsis lyrata subsp. lyrata TaxID=81972 RepID=D7MXJ7_ARALL|nr:predicted protein [Arabidopsis lyrata subsp. lyrata]
MYTEGNEIRKKLVFNTDLFNRHLYFADGSSTATDDDGTRRPEASACSRSTEIYVVPAGAEKN